MKEQYFSVMIVYLFALFFFKDLTFELKKAGQKAGKGGERLQTVSRWKKL